MDKFIKDTLKKVLPLFYWIAEKANQAKKEAQDVYEKISQYYKTHPKARKRTIIFGPPGLFLFILIIVVWVEIPSKRQLRNIKNQMATEVYSADSVLLGRFYIQDRTEVAYEDIAPAVIETLVATEDVRFYEHKGVDFISLGRVLIKSIFLGDESSGGGSTITQQLAKNLYPRKRYWILSMLINKLKEVITANRLETIYSKQELITLYLNTVPFPDNAFGIQAAAHRFYSVDASSLSINQAAVLIGSLKATHYYNPRLFPDRSLERRNTVIRQLVKFNNLDSVKADSIKSLPIVLKYSNITHHEGLAPYFREHLKAEIKGWCADHDYNLYTDGLKIYTTIDSRMQTFAESAVKKQMSSLQEQFFSHWGKEKPWKGNESVLDEAIARSSRYKRLKAQGLSNDDIIKELQKPIPMKVFTWKGIKEEVISPIDSIIHHLQYLNTGFLVMDHTNGEIKAWVGGIDHDFFQYDHIKTSTKRQVGSIFKPIVYATGIEEGLQPCDLISAGQQTYIDKEGEKWTPRNMQNDYELDYTMRGGLAYSVNTIAVKLIDKAGVDKTIKMARRMGIESDLPDVPSIALGSSSISLLEMVTAYGCIANEGMSVSPFYITAIVDQDGNVFKDIQPRKESKRAMSKETAQVVRSLLQTVVFEGTAAPVRWKYGAYVDVAGKTGTTQANADGWFMAFTPNLVMGSWVGADDPRIHFRYSNLGQGSYTALPIAGYFLKELIDDKRFKKVTAEKFKPIPYPVAGKLDCDLYEINDELLVKILRTSFERDSIMHADTLAEVKETFLEKLLERKNKIEEAKRSRDSLSILEQNLEDIGG